MSGRIVVGVDGSSGSDGALEWAAAEAQLRHAKLLVVHAEFARRAFLDAYRDLERAEEGVLARAVSRVRELAPDVEVSGDLYDPPAAAALLTAATDADLLVVGCRGLGEVKGVAIGSVSSECVHRARCPVVVVRP